MGDGFIRQYLEDLLMNVRTQVLLRLIQPYTRVTLKFVSKKLNIPLQDVEHLLITLILDKRIHGCIDQVIDKLSVVHGQRDCEGAWCVGAW